MPPFGPLNFGAPKLNKKYYSRKNGNVKHKNGESDIFCSWIHCRGRRLRRPSGKTFRFYSAFGEFETFSNGTSRAPSPTGGTRTACVVSGLTSVHIPGGMRPEVRGISHGLKMCHWHIFLTAFRFPYGKQKKDIRMDVLFCLVTRTGIEPMLPP